MARQGNTSNAVMASRRSAASSLDFFPTPPWATRALVEEVLAPEFLHGLDYGCHQGEVWDPCCGAGHMAIPLAEYFGTVRATDVNDWGFGADRNLDFTMATRESAGELPAWIIANPPFVLAERFVDRALTIATEGVAMLLRLQWLEGGDRYELIFKGDRKPSLFCPFVERVPMIDGCWDPEATTATAYAWFVWDAEGTAPRRTPIMHIPPGMALRYTRPVDEALANRGEAARRRAAQRQVEEV
ncbi:MAG: SAM-dependent DNA methyltransferase [Devosia sp.]